MMKIKKAPRGYKNLPEAIVEAPSGNSFSYSPQKVRGYGWDNFTNEGNLLPEMIAGLMILSIGFLFLDRVDFQIQVCMETH